LDSYSFISKKNIDNTQLYNRAKMKNEAVYRGLRQGLMLLYKY